MSLAGRELSLDSCEKLPVLFTERLVGMVEGDQLRNKAARGGLELAWFGGQRHKVKAALHGGFLGGFCPGSGGL